MARLARSEQPGWKSLSHLNTWALLPTRTLDDVILGKSLRGSIFTSVFPFEGIHRIIAVFFFHSNPGLRDAGAVLSGKLVAGRYVGRLFDPR